MIPRVRSAIFSGSFYPSEPLEIKRQIEDFLKEEKKVSPNTAIGCILPHAGYIYSGKVAAVTLAKVTIPEIVILLGPNHTGLGEAYSIVTEGVWKTPLGSVEIETNLARSFLRNCDYLKDDFLAHQQEHSLEVELPLLQYYRKDFKIVPFVFMSNDLTVLKQIGLQIAEVIRAKNYFKKVLFLASSDMTHYEPQKVAEAKDRKAISAILELNEEELAVTVSENDISMCGFAPVVVLLSAIKMLGARLGRLILYQTSGDVTKDRDSVVGYAGIIFI